LVCSSPSASNRSSAVTAAGSGGSLDRVVSHDRESRWVSIGPMLDNQSIRVLKL
jgi:hypothetical protein